MIPAGMHAAVTCSKHPLPSCPPFRTGSTERGVCARVQRWVQAGPMHDTNGPVNAAPTSTWFAPTAHRLRLCSGSNVSCTQGRASPSMAVKLAWRGRAWRCVSRRSQASCRQQR